MVRMLYVFLSTLLLVTSSKCQSAEKGQRIGDRGDPEVTILQGTVKGAKLEKGGERVDRFLSIPYGKPPVGDLRFQPTQPADPWEGTLDASMDLTPRIREKSCIQMKGTMRDTRGNEDCLYLNVWVYGGVEEARKDPLPVMVWIYGGAYAFGSSMGANVFDNWLYDQEPVVRHGHVIGITLEYRLGPLGFLSTGDDAAPGNYGLLDQVEALRWVKNNIWAFGGDDSKITVYGESAGSASTSFHMLSPLSKDLFNRGISQSGTALSSWAIVENPKRWALDVGAVVGCPTEDTHEMMDCLRVADVNDVVLSVHLLNFTKEQTVDLPWSAVIDGYFLPDYPQNLVGNSADKDYLLGNNDMDGHMFAGIDFHDINKDNTPMYHSDLVKAAGLLHYDTPQEVQDAMVFQYKAFTNDYDDTFYKKQVVQLYTDSMFAAPTHASAQSHAQVANRGVNTFVYLFSCPSKMPLLYPPWMGADHADDLQYVYGKPFLTPLVYTDGEREASEAFMTYWTNFAWTGDPNDGAVRHNKVPAEWKPYELDTKYYMEINGSIKDNGDAALGSNYRSDYFAFWEKLAPQIWHSSDGQCDSGLFSDDTASYASGCSVKDYQRITTFGCIQGEKKTWNGIPYSQYLGIPYATPITKTARFTRPKSPVAWQGTRDALSFSKACPQAPFDSLSMDEDCLYLNVYQPDPVSSGSSSSPNGYAVMIWFHGGGYSSGAGSDYDASVLSARENVIVVTVNYRLGALGFLSSSDEGVAGNMGLLDQQLALNWVKYNIANFGGDASRIVLFGQGAGADAVHMHSLSGLNADLGLDKAILQSGSALNFANYPDQSDMAKTLALRVGCSTQDGMMVSCLRSKDISAIISGQSKSQPLQFHPVVDGYFLTDTPSELMVNGNDPWSFMIGINRNDGSTHWDDVKSVTNYRQFHNAIKSQFKDEYGVRTDNIEFEYSLWSDPMFSSNVEEMQEQLLQINTDLDYALNAVDVADNSYQKTSSVYMYEFSRTSPLSATPDNFTLGAGHGEELPYVWGEIVFDVMSQGNYPDDSILSFDMMDYWSNFAQTGNPNIDELGYSSISTNWLPYSSAGREYIDLNAESTMLKSFKERKTQFWTQFLPSLQVSCSIEF